MNQREAFEKWYLEEFGRRPTDVGYETDICWRAWQAAKEQGFGEPVGVIKHRTHPMSDNPDAYVDWLFGGDEINLPNETELYIKA